MTITLDHAVVRCTDKDRAARFLADLLGLQAGDAFGPFASLQVDEHLTLLFDDRGTFSVGHFAFVVDEAVFAAALALVRDRAIEFGSGPGPQGDDRSISHRDGGTVVYVRDPDGNVFELMTVAQMGR